MRGKTLIMTSLGNQIGVVVRKLRKALAGNSKAKNETKLCSICVEDTHVDQMLEIQSCKHTYCFSCMSKHVLYKLRQSEGFLPKCPHDLCNASLDLKSCKKFLSPELHRMLSTRVKEASIPESQRIYCPYPRCSALSSKIKIKRSSGKTSLVMGRRKCPKCSRFFCVNCKAPWHRNMTCVDFTRKSASPSHEDHKLKTLANLHNWRQCPNCNHMVSLDYGCYHIYCRCRYDFCYSCGKGWEYSSPTCTCTR